MTGARPLLRLGRREAAKHKGRTALVGLLIGVPVFALSCALVLVMSMNPGGLTEQQRSIGHADDYERVLPGDSSPTPTSPPGFPEPKVVRSVTLRTTTVFTSRTASGRGLLRPLAATVGPVADPMLRGHIAVLAGRLPTRPGEVALNPRQADDIGVTVGGKVRLAVPKLTLLVVGLAGQADCGGCSDLFLAAHALPAGYGKPGDVSGVSQWGDDNGTTVFEQLADHGRVGGANEPLVYFGSSNQTNFGLGAFGVATFGLIWTGLVAAAALSVGARRRRRELGLLATNGADPAGLRLAVIAEGFVVGGVASVVGGVAGTAVGAAMFTTVRYWAQSWGAVLQVPWVWVIATPIVGTLAATIAAGASARSIRRASVADLLAGRGPQPAPPRRWLGAGLVLGAIGVATIGAENLSGPMGRRGWSLVVLGGVIATAGLCAVSVGLIGAMRAVRGPGTATRLVARDLSRHGVRGSAAVAVVALTVAGWAGIAVSLDRRDVFQDAAYQPTFAGRTVVVGASQSDPVGDGHGHLRLAGAPERIDSPTALAMVRAGLRVRRLHYATTSFSVVSSNGGRESYDQSSVVAVDPILDLFDPVDRARLEQGQVLDGGGGTGAGKLVGRPVTVSSMANSDFSPLGLAATRATLDRLGIPPRNISTELVGEGTGISNAAMRRLSRASSALNSNDQRLYVAGTSRSSTWVGYAALAAVTLLLFIVLAVCLALQRVESQGDDQVLYDLGAGPATRRSIAGARAGLITAAAVVPGVALGVAVRFAARDQSHHFGVPFLQLTVAIVGVPLLAWALFAATTHNRPPRPAG